MAINTKNTGASSITGLPVSTLEFPPLPETWEIVVDKDADELALKVTQITVDSDDEDETEMWETFERDSKPAYTEVAARGKVYHELQRATEVMTGVNKPKVTSDSKSASKDPRARNEISMASAAATADDDGDVKGKDEYESRKTQRAQKIHHKIVAKKHDQSLGAQLTDAVAKEDAFHKMMPVWETLRDSDSDDRIKKRKAFEINKQLKKDIKMRRNARSNGPSRTGGFRDDGGLPVLV